MIVRDEEKHLGEALTSIKDFVDEIVIVDTGSVDKTVEIAKSFGARIEIHPWKDNFSLHRNQSLKMAQMEWMFIFDADDRLFEGDGEKIKEFLSGCKTDLARAYVINSASEGNETSFKQIRFIKRGSEFKYKRRVHNSFDIPRGYEIAQAPVRVRHIGYDLTEEESNKKFERTTALLELEMVDNPRDAYTVEHYANQFRLSGKHKDPAKCLKYATISAAATEPRQDANWWIHLRSLNLMAWSLFELGQYEDSIKIGQELLHFKNNHLDAMLVVAFSYRALRMDADSKRWFSNYIKCSQTYDPIAHADGAHINFPNMQEMAIIEIQKLNKGARQCRKPKKRKRAKSSS